MTKNRTTLVILILLIIAIGLIIFKLTYHRPAPPFLAPSPSPISSPSSTSPTPINLTPLPKTVSTPPQLIPPPSIQLLPSAALLYSFTQTPLTQNQFTSLAGRLNIESSLRTINDPVQGTIYQLTSGQQFLQSKSNPTTLSYNRFGTFPPQSSKFPSDLILTSSITQITSQLSPEIDLQPQISQKRFLKITQDNPILSSETDAHIIEVNITPPIDNYPVISSTPNLFPSYAHLNKQGQLLALEITPFSITPIANYPLKTLPEITDRFTSEATIIYYERLDSRYQPTQMTANSIKLAYLLTTHDPSQQILLPIYLIQGTISLDKGYLATAVIPAIKSEYLLQPLP